MKRIIDNVLLIALVLSPLACGFNLSTASVSDAQLARGVNEKNEAVDPTTSFDSHEPVIHAVVKLANAPDKTKVKARWIATKVEGDPVENQLVDEANVEAGGPNNVVDF